MSAGRVIARIPALTIWRPWTTCILRYGKSVENRSWTTNYRGPVWIHAGKKFDDSAISFASRLGIGLSTDPADHPTGIVALATLTEVHEDGDLLYDCEGCGPWGIEGECHWWLSDIRPVTPVECAGKQGLWWPPSNLTDQAAFEVAR